MGGYECVQGGTSGVSVSRLYRTSRKVSVLVGDRESGCDL